MNTNIVKLGQIAHAIAGSVRRPLLLMSVAAVFFAVCPPCSGQTGSAHRFEDIAVRPDRLVALTVNGAVPESLKAYYDLYMIDISSDLTEWMPWRTLLRTNAILAPLIELDTGTAQSPSVFYRLNTNLLPTPFLKPTGPFLVGTVSKPVTDGSRSNRYNVKGNSSFMIQIWYPAEARPGQLPSKWVSPAVARDPQLAPYNGVIAQLFAHAVSNAPIVEARFPVVIYSHGANDEMGSNFLMPLNSRS